MRPSQARFVTACQQLLALGVVLAVLTPAAGVISIDVVGEAPSGGRSRHVPGDPAGGAAFAAYTREAARPSVLPDEVVDPKLREYPLTAPAGMTARPTALAGRATALRGGSEAVTSRPDPVTGYGAVGVTWEKGQRPSEENLGFEVRTRTDADWSEWMTLPYDPEHGPDPRSEEGRHARPGTDVLLVGKVDQVQVRSESTQGAPPAGMTMSVIAPGHADRTTTERAAIETDGLDPTGPVQSETTEPTGGDALDLQATSFTPKPVIYSRQQWGADERMRDKSSLHYFEVHAGFVHHTVNANDYSRAEVPGILRSIYAYHTRSLGWSDVGYNFLVDKFGRIWEGRYGGVDRPVVGAHTLGYNDWSFAMSAIGNYETVGPRDAMLQAYGSLFAWKLSLHGVDAASTRQWVGTRYFQAINGHRDAGQTACPGRYLYAKLPVIRRYAARAQSGWSGRELRSNLTGTANPDLIARRASDGQAFIVPTGGLLGLEKPRTQAGLVAGADAVVGSPDLTGDGLGDVLVRSANGTAAVRPASATGFGSPIKSTSAFAGRALITAVGDLDEDGHNDLVARNSTTGVLNAYLGNGTGGFVKQVLPGAWTGYDKLAATGDLDGDHHVDLLARDTAGRLWLHPGTGAGGFAPRVQLAGSWGGYDTITGFGDFTRDGKPDLVVRVAGGKAYVLPSHGNATFGRRIGPLSRLTNGSITGTGNTTGSRAPDLVARRGDDLATIAHHGTFNLGRPIATGVNLSGANSVFNIGDWDRDGFGDIVFRRISDGALILRRGNGKGGFAAAVKIADGFGAVRLLASVGDMTGDGKPDLMGQPRGGNLRIYPGNGLAGLKPSYVAHSPVTAARQIGIGRWNADGAPDTFFRKDDGSLSVFLGNGPGGLTKSKALGLDLAPYSSVVGVRDMRLRGRGDLIARARGTGDLYLLDAMADGFQPRRYLGDGLAGFDLLG
jgi:hypothetical protein